MVGADDGRGDLRPCFPHALLRDDESGNANGRQDVRDVQIDLHAPELDESRRARGQPVMGYEALEVLFVVGPLRVERAPELLEVGALTPPLALDANLVERSLTVVLADHASDVGRVEDQPVGALHVAGRPRTWRQTRPGRAARPARTRPCP